MYSEIYRHLDIIAEISSLLGAVLCGFLMQVILRERTPLVGLQRVALGFLGMAMVANGSFYFPPWALVDGHRPTGAIVDLLLFLNLAVMSFRGYVILHHRNGVSPDRDRRRVSS